LSLFQAEFSILTDLAPLPAPPVIAATYSTLINPVLGLFSDTIASLISLIKRSLHKYTFLALVSYESLASLQPRWDAVLAKRAGSGMAEGNELRDVLQALRAVCMRSFPEFLADIKIAGAGKGSEMNTGVADFTISVRVVFPFSYR
jgi:exocyst complex protein 7